MIKEISIYVGRFRCNMKYSNENEKKILEEISAEVNQEFNKLLISFGRIDERMLLFFMLFNIQKEIFSINNPENKENFLEIFKNIAMFISQSTNIDNQLIVGLICKKNEMREILTNHKKLSKKDNIVNNSFVENFNEFFDNTIEKIINITNII